VASGRFTVTEIAEQHKSDLERYNRICETLMERAYADMEEEGFKRDEVVMQFILEMRYGGQLHEVVTRPQRIVVNNVDDFNHILTTFEEEYIRLYSEGAMYPGGGVEIYNIVVEVSAGVPKPTPIKHPLKGKDPSAAHKGSRDVWFDKGYVSANVYEMLKLDHGNEIEGPAIIEGVDTTFVVPPDRNVRVDEHLNMVMTEKG
jgi:N-methylhydantoinase A/oxoprolinase/acetone carboxylase beta subunit